MACLNICNENILRQSVNDSGNGPYFHINAHIPLSLPLLLHNPLQLSTAAGQRFLSHFYPPSHPRSLSHSVSLSLSSALDSSFSRHRLFHFQIKSAADRKIHCSHFKTKRRGKEVKQVEAVSLCCFSVCVFILFSITSAGLLRTPALVTRTANKVTVGVKSSSWRRVLRTSGSFSIFILFFISTQPVRTTMCSSLHRLCGGGHAHKHFTTIVYF